MTRLSQAGEIFHAWAQLPITRSAYASKLAALQAAHFPDAQPLPGVPELLSTLEARKIHIALATSSHAANFRLKTSHLPSLFKHFPENTRVLGDDPRIPKGKGKPAPDIYLLALKLINDGIRKQGGEEVKPEECLVFEDSVPGVEAGRRAGMRVVWCPHSELLKEYRGREKEVLAGLAHENQVYGNGYAHVITNGHGTANRNRTTNGHETANGHGTTNGHGAANGYDNANRHGAANGYGTTNGYATTNGNGTANEHGTANGYENGRVDGVTVSRAVDDGWAQLMHTLIDFPYEDYGIHAH